MLRAIYIRTLNDGVSDDEYIDAWMPEGVTREDYPAKVSVSHSTTHERQTVTVLEFDGDPDHVLDALPGLVRPDWRDRVAQVVGATDIETIFVETAAFGAAGTPASAATAS